MLAYFKVPHLQRDRHASRLMAMLNFIRTYDRSTIAFPEGFGKILGDWIVRVHNGFKDPKFWLNVGGMPDLICQMSALEVLWRCVEELPDALENVKSEQDLRHLAGRCKEFVEAGKVLAERMVVTYEPRGTFVWWVSREARWLLRHVRELAEGFECVVGVSSRAVVLM
jgi:hypothetical protein